MCFQITSGPTVTPSKISAPQTVNVGIELRSATPATVTVTCNPGPLGPTQSRSVKLNATGTSVSFPVQVNAAPGAYQIEVQVAQPGCVTERLGAGLVVLVPEPAVKS